MILISKFTGIVIVALSHDRQPDGFWVFSDENYNTVKFGEMRASLTHGSASTSMGDRYEGLYTENGF